MVINPFKIFLFVAGGSAAAATTAYVSGALDPYFAQTPPAQIASLPAPEPAKTEPPATATQPPQTLAAVEPAAVPAAPAKTEVLAPSFDVVRVEANGSIVIAGKAAPNAKIEALTGSRVIGAATAGPEGDFAIVVEEPLKPGDYQIVLRSTAPGNIVAMSVETAVVSVPEHESGQVLALVEEPGKPAELITKPEPVQPKSEAPAPAAATEQPKPPAEQPAAPPVAAAPAEQPVAAAPSPEPPKQAAAPAAPPAEPKVVVEAVEIEGKKIFIAGSADAGRLVRAYANEILIGEAKTAPTGRFLIEAERDLPVGDYIMRVDALEPDGAKVVARAAVPFEREPGEAIAAVAPPPAAPAQPAPATQEVAAADPAKPADPVQPAASAPPASAETTAVPAPAVPAETPAAPAEVAATPAPETTAPKLQSVDGSVIIRRGDTLWRISRRVYGFGTRYSTIYLANQEQISDPDRIWPGQVFKVPEKSKEGETADMGAMGDQLTKTE